LELHRLAIELDGPDFLAAVSMRSANPEAEGLEEGQRRTKSTPIVEM